MYIMIKYLFVSWKSLIKNRLGRFKVKKKVKKGVYFLNPKMCVSCMFYVDLELESRNISTIGIFLSKTLLG